MSQQEKLIALLVEMSIPFEQQNHAQRTVIQLEASRGHPIVDGYTGFVCQFAFDKEGTFQKVLIAE